MYVHVLVYHLWFVQILSQMSVAHACNPSYSRGREQEDHCSKSAWANSSRNPILKKNLRENRVGGVLQGEGPEFKPSYCKKKKKKNLYLLKKPSCHIIEFKSSLYLEYKSII
jgi:hypothetical protein